MPAAPPESAWNEGPPLASETAIDARERARREPAAAKRLSAWLKGYAPLPGVPDELFDAQGRPRDHWLAFLGEFAAYSESAVRGGFGKDTRHLRDTGASHRIYGEENERSWPIDPMPLILGQAEWEEIAAGVCQRAELIEAVLQDIYGEGRLVAEGALRSKSVV